MRYVQRGLDEIRLSLRRQQRMLESELRTVNVEIKRSTSPGNPPSTALIEARTSILVGLKSLQATQSKFVLDITRSKDLLSNLDPDSGASGTVINIVLPDWGAIPVAETMEQPPGEPE